MDFGTAIVVTSGKGGTGKTSLTGGVASCLARLGKRVLCIDMDIGLRNLDLSLGMSDRALMDFSDVMEIMITKITGSTQIAAMTMNSRENIALANGETRLNRRMPWPTRRSWPRRWGRTRSS